MELVFGRTNERTQCPLGITNRCVWELNSDGMRAKMSERQEFWQHERLLLEFSLGFFVFMMHCIASHSTNERRNNYLFCGIYIPFSVHERFPPVQSNPTQRNATQKSMVELPTNRSFVELVLLFFSSKQFPDVD